MNKITSLKQLKDLIPWFNRARYKTIERYNLEQVHEELALRYGFKILLERGESTSEYQSMLFTDMQPRTDTESLNYDENVHPIHSLDIVHIARQLPSNRLDFEGHSYLHLMLDVHNNTFDGKGISVGISLSHATDAEITEELARLLKKIRQELDVPEPNRPPTAKGNTHKKLFAYGVFEYLDLTLWLEVSGHKMKPALIADALPERYFDYDYVRKNTASYARKAMTFEYLEQLKSDIKNK